MRHHYHTRGRGKASTRLEDRTTMYLETQLKYWSADPSKNAEQINEVKMILKRRNNAIIKSKDIKLRRSN